MSDLSKLKKSERAQVLATAKALLNVPKPSKPSLIELEARKKLRQVVKQLEP